MDMLQLTLGKKALRSEIVMDCELASVASYEHEGRLQGYWVSTLELTQQVNPFEQGRQVCHGFAPQVKGGKICGFG